MSTAERATSTVAPITLHGAPIEPLEDVLRYLTNPPCLRTVHRWRLRGVKGVRLECRAVGRRIYTSRAALEQFLARVADVDQDPLSERPSPRELSRQEKEDEAFLEKHGVIEKASRKLADRAN